MNYELCKELKDAGFKSNSGNIFISNYINKPIEKCENCAEEYGFEPYNDEVVYIPSLSELIEACGNDFECLKYRGSNKWECGEISPFELWTTLSEGSTPEEAVARLWLEINKK